MCVTINHFRAYLYTMTSKSSAKAGPPRTPAAEAGVTPMMAQFLEIKGANPDYLLWYRMGDFYELFFDDAVVAASALDIQLTKRGKHLGEDIPMCGVPVRRAEEYLRRLIAQGHRVAVCEQQEDPAQARKRGPKAVVHRAVVRLVTAGTLTEDELLDAKAANYLTALFRTPNAPSSADEVFGLASIDISTGQFVIATVSDADLPGELHRLRSSEIIVSDDLADTSLLAGALEGLETAVTPVPKPYFDSLAGERDLKAKLGVATLDGFGGFERHELAAVGALLKYVDVTQLGHRPALRPPERVGPETILVVDKATRSSLEITAALRGGRHGSLLHAIDRTVTGAGARTLADRLTSPLTDPDAIGARLDALAYLLDQAMLRRQSRDLLKSAPDIARALNRLSLDRGGPRDLGAVRDGLNAAERCAELLRQSGDVMGLPTALASVGDRLSAVAKDLEHLLTTALADELPIYQRDGGFVRAGFQANLDENLALRDQSRQIIAGLQADYAEKTDIKALKIRHNNVLGYFVETTAAHADRLMQRPLSDRFIHRQTLASAVRFTTTELGELEAKITAAADRALSIELEIFETLKTAVLDAAHGLGEIAEALGELDVQAALAELADEQNYVRPSVDHSTEFLIEGGRHPVVEQALIKGDQGPFIENGCVLGGEGDASRRILVVTGPNMAGKSTFLRQNALIVILAQMGSFVPASKARIGVVDRLFSRVGASDDLAGGRSTFMVEMVETAGILNQAGDRALVILDEIGRGTATFDGLSIAWATVEHLHEVNRCRALFATHYHELTALAQKLTHAANATMDVKEWRDEIIFLHKVVAGAADRSYGIQVGKLAGLPEAVIARAAEVLDHLENTEQRSTDDLADDLPLFAAARPQSGPTQGAPSAINAALEMLNPDNMTPKEALDALYHLKTIARDEAD